jgi:hypothetical protein
MARRRLAVAQDRYKRIYDRLVPPNNSSLLDGSHFYVRREVHEPNVNPKLDQQVDGPYENVFNDEHTRLLRMGDSRIRVSSDRVTPAPEQIGPYAEERRNVTTDSTEPSKSKPQEKEPDYLIKNIVGAKHQIDGSHLIRIRWYGYGREDDTWEPSHHSPKSMRRRYHKRAGLPILTLPRT